jgi:ribosomal protein L11 methyltransferase
MLVWRKLTSAKWEDAWVERLSFLDPSRLAIFALRGAKSIRIEAYDLKKGEAQQLVKRFGGQLRELKKTDFVSANSAPRPPLLIRDKRVIVRSEKEKAKCSRQFPHRSVLVIPAAMAFGTGDHATTATCLRMLCDLSEKHLLNKWEMLDLGTGTGILAIAARTFGAKRADAFDFDPACVRAVRENLAANQVRGICAAKLNVLNWTPERKWDVVTANLYSEILVRASAQIVQALKPDGTLILSGILREQEPDTVRAFTKNGLRVLRTVRKGKWVTLLTTRKLSS